MYIVERRSGEKRKISKKRRAHLSFPFPPVRLPPPQIQLLSFLIKVMGFEEKGGSSLDPGMGGKREGVGGGGGWWEKEKGKAVNKDWRKVDVGEVPVGVPVNHSEFLPSRVCSEAEISTCSSAHILRIISSSFSGSLSPDGRTLLSVGDSNEVHLVRSFLFLVVVPPFSHTS